MSRQRQIRNAIEAALGEPIYRGWGLGKQGMAFGWCWNFDGRCLLLAGTLEVAAERLGIATQ